MALQPLKIFLVEIADKYVRENFRLMQQYLESDTLRRGNFKFYELKVLKSGRQRFQHDLRFKPTDLIQLSISRPDTATITWHYDTFTDTTFELTASAPCTVRLYAGSHEK